MRSASALRTYKNYQVIAMNSNNLSGNHEQYPVEPLRRITVSSGRQSPFISLCGRAESLGKGDYDAAIHLLQEANTANLGNTEVLLLQKRIAGSTELPADVIKAIAEDACSLHPEYGYLNTHSAVASAVDSQISELTSSAVWTEGALYAYPRDDTAEGDTATERFFKPTSLEELDNELITYFPNIPLVQRPSDRKEVIKRIIAARSQHDFFDDAPAGVNLSNGFLRHNTLTGNVELLPHSPDHKARMQLDVTYDRTAAAPVFQAGLERLLNGNKKKIRAVLQFMACTVFGFMPPHDRVRTVMVLYGPPRSGKSTLIEMISRFIPNYARTSVPPEKWSDKNYLAMLKGIRLNAVTELSADGRGIAGAVFKQVASHETVTARQVYQQPVSFRPRALHMFGCNELPRVSEKNDSLERRFLVISFGHSLELDEVVPDFLEHIWQEAPGIINLLAAEAQKLSQEGRFTLPDDHQSLVVQIQHGPNPAMQVARAWVEPAMGERITSAQLQAALRVAANGLGLDTSDWKNSSHMKEVARSLGTLYGATRHVLDGAPFYRNVRFKAPYASMVTDNQRASEESNQDTPDS
ncbi:MAG: phage/plasmid primase, P4 family [Alphaproteobacteria bacterium]